MRHQLALLFLALTVLTATTGCGGSGGDFFDPVSADFNTKTVLIPEGYSFQVLFSEGDLVTRKDGVTGAAKGNHDFIGYIPIDGSSTHGYLYVNHETKGAHDELGDGGGGTIFEIKKEGNTWAVVGNFNHVDFTGVGGTLRNCGGTVTPHGTILSAEETEPTSNLSLQSYDYSMRDTSDANGLKRYLNMGWMVEIDPTKREATRKVYRMGRFVHEDAVCMPDGKTVYLTDDNDPAVFFKFVASEPNNYRFGQLYAYQQSADAQSGDWITLPMHIDSLYHIRDVAMRLGATLFQRHEWIDKAGDKLYIAETGNEQFGWNRYVRMGAKPANYFLGREVSGADIHTYADPFGRILEFDLATGKMRSLLECGLSAEDSDTHLSNPDGLCAVTQNGKNYLVISEDLISISQGRVSTAARLLGETYNELYFLPLSVDSPTVANVQRFMAAPRGCETTGTAFTPDGKTCFISIQHPDANNPAPFNKSVVIAIEGFPGTGAAPAAPAEEPAAVADH